MTGRRRSVRLERIYRAAVSRVRLWPDDGV